MTNNYHGHFFGEQVKKELHFTFTNEPNKISTEGISIFVQDAYERCRYADIKGCGNPHKSYIRINKFLFSSAQKNTARKVSRQR